MGSDAIGGANGGSAGARTQDQYLKRVLLYQLSYRPVRWRGGRDNTLAPARCPHRLRGAIAPVAEAAPDFWPGVCAGVPAGELFRRGHAASSVGEPVGGALVRYSFQRSNTSNTRSNMPTHRWRYRALGPRKARAERARRHAPRWCAHLTTIYGTIVIVRRGASV